MYGGAMASCSRAVSTPLNEVLCLEELCNRLVTDSAVCSQLVCGGCSSRSSNALTQMKTL